MKDRKGRAGKSKRVSAKAASPHPEPAAPPARAEVQAPPAPAPKPVIEAAPAALKPIEPTIEKDIQIMTNETKKTVETAQKAAQQTADRVQAAFGEMNERTKSQLERNARIMEEVSDLTKGNVEAFVASGRAAAEGFQSLGQEAADYGRRSFEEASATMKSFAEAKSPTDFFRLQSDYARGAFDSMVAESSKMSEQVIKIAGEVAEPITNRASVAAEKVKAFAA